MCMCVYIYIYLYTCIYIYICMYTYVCVYMYIYIYVYIYIYIHMCVYIYIYIHMYTPLLRCHPDWPTIKSTNGHPYEAPGVREPQKTRHLRSVQVLRLLHQGAGGRRRSRRRRRRRRYSARARRLRLRSLLWILSRGGCSGRGVQWIGVVLHSEIV